jgi:hypothetical protein
MNRVTFKNITKTGFPLIIKTPDGKKQFTIFVAKGAELEILDSQISGDVLKKIKHRFLQQIKSEVEITMEATPEVTPTQEVPQIFGISTSETEIKEKKYKRNRS